RGAGRAPHLRRPHADGRAPRRGRGRAADALLHPRLPSRRVDVLGSRNGPRHRVPRLRPAPPRRLRRLRASPQRVAPRRGLRRPLGGDVAGRLLLRGRRDVLRYGRPPPAGRPRPPAGTRGPRDPLTARAQAPLVRRTTTPSLLRSWSTPSTFSPSRSRQVLSTTWPARACSGSTSGSWLRLSATRDRSCSSLRM